LVSCGLQETNRGLWRGAGEISRKAEEEGGDVEG